MIFCIRIKLRMNIHHVLFFCFLSALQDGNTGLINAINLYAGAEGGRGSLTWHFTSSGSTKFFCKGKCKEEDILIKTDDVTAQSGRYSIKYKDGSSGRRIVTVTITQLTESDSGRYRFGLGGSSVPDAYRDFDLIVIDAATLGDNSRFSRVGTVGGSVTRKCSDTVYGSRMFFCKDECKKEEDILVEAKGKRAQNGRYSIEYREGSVFGLYVTITQLKKSDTGRYRCGYSRALSPNSSYTFPIFVVDAATLGDNTRFSRVAIEGGDMIYPCKNTVNGSRKFFCKDECKKEGDILVETEENRAQNGRYSIEYREGSTYGLSVTITQLKKSDTGRYRCGYGRALSPDSSNTFLIFVVDAVSEVSLPGYFWPLVVFLPLVVCVPVIVVLLAVVLLLLYKLKKRRNSSLNTRGTSDSRNMELSVIYENCPPVSMYEDSIYQSLDPDSSDPDQTYSALTANK